MKLLSLDILHEDKLKNILRCSEHLFYIIERKEVENIYVMVVAMHAFSAFKFKKKWVFHRSNDFSAIIGGENFLHFSLHYIWIYSLGACYNNEIIQVDSFKNVFIPTGDIQKSI